MDRRANGAPCFVSGEYNHYCFFLGLHNGSSEKRRNCTLKFSQIFLTWLFLKTEKSRFERPGPITKRVLARIESPAL